MTEGPGSVDDPMPALEALADALAEFVTAARGVAEAGAAVMSHPEAREAVATALTFVLDGVMGSLGDFDIDPDG